DEEGTSCLANDEIFTGLANMGYEKMSNKLTLYNDFFSPQWKFLIHTILQCLSAKPPPGILVKNIEAGVPFYMFLRFMKLLVDHQLGDMSHHQYIYDNPSLTKKQPKAHKVPSPEPSLDYQLPSPSNDPIPDADKDILNFQELMNLCTRLSNKVLDLKSEVIDIKSSFTAYNLDLQHSEKVLSMQDIDEEEPAEVKKASAPRRRRGVVILDPKETATSVIVYIKLDAKLNANINWNDVVDKVKRSERQNNVVMRYQALKRKPLTEAQARKNMMIYLKNMAGFKMNFFKDIDEDVEVHLEEAHAKAYNLDLQHSEKVLSMQDIDEEEPAEVKKNIKKRYIIWTYNMLKRSLVCRILMRQSLLK
nr:hypothetical protein [Tanacetum cinerariifolium]